MKQHKRKTVHKAKELLLFKERMALIKGSFIKKLDHEMGRRNGFCDLVWIFYVSKLMSSRSRDDNLPMEEPEQK